MWLRPACGERRSGRPVSLTSEIRSSRWYIGRTAIPPQARGGIIIEADQQVSAAGIEDSGEDVHNNSGKRSRFRLRSRRGAAVLLGLALVVWTVTDWYFSPPMVPDDYVLQPAVTTVRGRVVDEDGQPVAGAEVRSSPWFHVDRVTTTTDSDGRFEVPGVRRDRWDIFIAIKEQPDRSVLRGSARSGGPILPTTTGTITLKPEQSVSVRVTDLDGRPVPNAQVTGNGHWEVAAATTDESGLATLRWPADAPPFWIVASRPGLGRDYFENYQSRPGSTARPLPDIVELKLRGVEQVSVQVVDSSDRPLSGIRVAPWYLKLKNKQGHLTVPTEPIVTDDSGTAVFEVPANVEERVGFEVIDHPRWRRQRGAVEDNTETFVIRLERNALVRGRVAHTDGADASGIQITGQGAAEDYDQFSGVAWTRPDGRWDMWVAPHQTCMFAVDDRNWATQPVDEIRLEENELREGIELTLVKGTVIRGRITQGDEDNPQPAAEKHVYLSRQGSIHRRKTYSNPRVVHASIGWRTFTNANGEYSFRVADGTYHLRLPVVPVTAAIELPVAGEKEIIHDGHTTAEPPRIEMTGLVTNSAGEPAAEAIVYSTANRANAEKLRIPAGDDGRYWMERTEEPTLVYAKNKTGTEAVFLQVAAGTQQSDITLAPAAQVTATVRKANGDIVSGCTVSVLVWHTGSTRQSGDNITQETLTSDARGQVIFQGVPPGANILFSCWPDGTTKRPAQSNFTVIGTGKLTAPDIKAQKERPFWSTLF